MARALLLLAASLLASTRVGAFLPSVGLAGKSVLSSRQFSPQTGGKVGCLVGRGATAARSRIATGGLLSCAAKLEDKYWDWNGYKTRYQSAGEDNDGPSVILVHGFGGNADHWRKNTQVLADQGFRVYAIDLIGYGYSDKPDPQSMASVNGELKRDLSSYLRFAKEGTPSWGPVGTTHFTDMGHPLGSGYNFYTWADQLADFSEQVIKDPKGVFAVCNSIGSCAGMQFAIDRPEGVRGVVICDPSLRMLNVKRQPPIGVPFVSALQTVLRETPVGEAFFGVVATENTVRSVLQQAYGDESTVTDELVAAILDPGKTDNAPRVFLDFISYSAGPLPEEQLEVLSSGEFRGADDKPSIPVGILWGDKDPWEPVETGRVYGEYACVDQFEVLEGVGHCPQDEAPQLVNPLVASFVKKHSGVAVV
mmetsp:Transcript_16101/g.40558  ORF Transcript_16101/g.40558 Transcript_16101/m.40558 type:complete len:421 (-) Transcript_16101:101-1363(-)